MSTNIKPCIAWEKWYNPFYGDTEAQNTQIAEQDDNDESVPTPQFKAPIPFITTTMGVIPVTEHTMPEKIFQFWTGHTNFNLSPNVVKIISAAPGVETLEIYSRYRFRVGIGKLFKESDVKLRIQKDVLKYVKSISKISL